MSQDEFVKFHGIQAWHTLVEWRQKHYRIYAPKCDACAGSAGNANIIVHSDVIRPVLHLLGLKSTTILEAQKEICERRNSSNNP